MCHDRVGTELGEMLPPLTLLGQNKVKFRTAGIYDWFLALTCSGCLGSWTFSVSFYLAPTQWGHGTCAVCELLPTAQQQGGSQMSGWSSLVCCHHCREFPPST